VYPVACFRDLDRDVLSRVSSYTRRLQQWFSEENVHAVPKVIAEMARFRDILRNKVEALNRLDRLKAARMKEPEDECEKSLGEENRRLLNDVCFGYVNACRLAGKNHFVAGEPESFSLLEDAVVRAAALSRSKRDFNRRHGHYLAQPADLHADEQIAAAAIYRSVFEHEDCCIVSPDSDIPRILVDACKYIEEVELRGDRLASAALRKHPVRVYFVRSAEEDGNLRLQLDSSIALRSYRPVESGARLHVH
jgi:hypothetical protein